MVVLGLSAFYHDSAAALVVDGTLVAAAQEERFTRRKHDPAYPRHAIDACLRTAGLTRDDVELVAFYEKPLRKLDRVLDTVMATAPAGRKRFVDAMPSWFVDKLRVEDIVREHLGHAVRVVFAPHHVSHAASAFFASPFDEAAVLTIDGVGEWATNSWGRGEGSQVRLEREIRFPHSLGLLYSGFTEYLGFRVNNGEYKVMGLAPYGRPRYAEVILAHLIELADDGSYRLNLEHFDFLAGDRTTKASFGDLLGGPRRAPEAELTQRHMDVAASIQRVCEQIVLQQARHALAQTGSANLCMAGGVALNSVANGKLLREPAVRGLWIQPAAGDSGGAVGAALWGWHHVLDHPRPPRDHDAMSGAVLGPPLDTDHVDEVLQAHGLAGTRLTEDALIEDVAGRLADGQVVGWAEGRMEYGPRALGHRSILADPSRAEMQRTVNARIKFREGFRPFAPMVPAAQASAWFDLPAASPYMLLVVPVVEAQRLELSEADAARVGLDRLAVPRSTIPAVTHVDDSARVQTVDPDTHPRIHALLSAFGARTGSPVLLNTSFNLRGEPIVATVQDAVASFLASGMDALVLGDVLVQRPPDREPTGVKPEPPVFEREVTPHELRTFGVGGGLLMGLLAWLTSGGGGWFPGLLAVLAALLLLPGLASPAVLKPVYGTVQPLARRLGHLNGWVLLSAIHLLVITPISMLRRRVSGDPLATPPGWLEVEDPDGHRPDRMF